MKKSLVLPLVFFIFFIVFISIVFASCSESQVIMKLSSNSNAHGEVYDGSDYPIQLCYNEIYGKEYPGASPHFCSGNNIVLRLSSSTNAHAEIPSENNYPVSVCYGDLECVSASGSCPQDYVGVASLSSETNSHLALFSYSDYNLKICCKSPFALCVPSTCASLGKNCSIHSDGCGGTLDCGTCLGQDVCTDGLCVCVPNCSEKVCGPDGCGGSCGDCLASQYCDLGVCYFTPVPEALWEDMKGQSLGEGTLYPSIFVHESLGTKIKLVLNEPNYLPIGTGVTFELWEKDTWPNPDDYIATFATIVVSSGESFVIWNVSFEEIDELTDDYNRFYFKTNTSESENLQETSSYLELIKYSSVSGEDCGFISSCGQYQTEISCNFNDCSVESFEELTSSCGQKTKDVLEMPGCYYFNKCSCKWNDVSEKCSPYLEEAINPDCEGLANPYSLGTCNLESSFFDEVCDENGFLSYSWGAFWDWGANNYPSEEQVPGYPGIGREYSDGSWHIFSSLKEDCVDGNRVIPCPAEIALSFFTSSMVLIAIAIIALVYYFLFLFKRKRVKRKSKKTSRKISKKVSKKVSKRKKK